MSMSPFDYVTCILVSLVLEPLGEVDVPPLVVVAMALKGQDLRAVALVLFVDVQNFTISVVVDDVVALNHPPLVGFILVEWGRYSARLSVEIRSNIQSESVEF